MRCSGVLGLLAAVATTTVSAHQKPLQDAAVKVNAEGYGVYQSTSSPGHSIRIKEQNSTLCDAHSRQYTGWLDVDRRHFFFWYFESQNSEKDDPLTLWQTGGPGGSDMLGMLMETGPCAINKDGKGTRYNPYGWSRNSSLLFIDQPAGVGFSYHDDDIIPSTSAETAADIRHFLEIFISQVFPQKKHVPFHITGESYSGHYTPYLAAEILNHNEKVHLKGPDNAVTVPLKTIAMGNPALSFSAMAFGSWETLCTTKPGVSKPVLNETTCDDMANALPEAMKLMKICNENPDFIICTTAFSYSDANIYNPYGTPGTDNPYDITKPCVTPEICYYEGVWIGQYMNTPWVREVLDVPKKVPPFNWVSEEVNRAFMRTVDAEVNTDKLVAQILAAGVDVLIYEGKFDLACNAAGNRYWSHQFKWPGQAAFNAVEFSEWFVDGDEIDRHGKSSSPVGEFKEVKIKVPGSCAHSKKRARFAFMTHNGAGHMVPYDKPKQALAMLNAWIFGQEFA